MGPLSEKPVWQTKLTSSALRGCKGDETQQCERGQTGMWTGQRGENSAWVGETDLVLRVLLTLPPLSLCMDVIQKVSCGNELHLNEHSDLQSSSLKPVTLPFPPHWVYQMKWLWLQVCACCAESCLGDPVAHVLQRIPLILSLICDHVKRSAHPWKPFGPCADNYLVPLVVGPSQDPNAPDHHPI